MAQDTIARVSSPLGKGCRGRRSRRTAPETGSPVLAAHFHGILDGRQAWDLEFGKSYGTAVRPQEGQAPASARPSRFRSLIETLRGRSHSGRVGDLRTAPS